MLDRMTDRNGEKLMDPEELEKTRVEQFKRFIERKQEEAQLEADQKEEEMKILAKRKAKIMENIWNFPSNDPFDIFNSDLGMKLIPLFDPPSSPNFLPVYNSNELSKTFMIILDGIGPILSIGWR